MKRIAYLGPENSFSSLAAKKVQKGGDELMPLPSFCACFRYLHEGKADKAVVPIENSTEGNVNEVMDELIFQNEKNPVFITADLILKIEHFLIGLKGVAFEKVETIYTHWQGYGQCRSRLQEIAPNAKIVFSDSTSAAVQSVKSLTHAAIGGRQAIKEEHEVYSKAVNDNLDNSTKFVVLSSDNSNCIKNDKMSIVFGVENKPGRLLKMLEILEKYKVNMTRLESRPHKTVLGKYVFFVDLGGNQSNDNVIAALEEIKRATKFYRFLGNYKRFNML